MNAERSSPEALAFRDPVAKKDIPRLTPALAETYAARGSKTLTRDLNELVTIGLRRVVDGRYQADTNLLMPLRPLTVPADTNGRFLAISSREARATKETPRVEPGDH